MSDESYVVNVVARNDGADELRIVVEPWAEEFLIPTGGELDVEFDGPARDPIHVDHQKDRMIVYGFRGSSALARRHGVIIWKAHQRLAL